MGVPGERGAGSCVATRGAVPLHPGSGKRPGRRVTQRHQRQQRVRSRAFEQVLGFAILAGPLTGVGTKEWSAVVHRAERQSRRLWHTKPSRVSSGQFAGSGKEKKTRGPNMVSSRSRAPTWAHELFKRSDLSRGSSLTALLQRCFDSAARYCRPSPEARGETRKADDFFGPQLHNSYSVSAAEKSKTFRTVVPERLALPPVGLQPVDVRSFLEWPYDELFSTNNLSACKYTAAELAARDSKQPRATVHMAEGREPAELYLLLEDRSAAWSSFPPSLTHPLDRTTVLSQSPSPTHRTALSWPAGQETLFTAWRSCRPATRTFAPRTQSAQRRASFHQR
jgi:hypothetical protein